MCQGKFLTGREFVNLALLLHGRLGLDELRNKRIPKVVSPGVEQPCCETDNSATSSKEVIMHVVVVSAVVVVGMQFPTHNTHT